MPPRSRKSKSVIRVRMYRVGFGDCFLVTFPGPHHVLVDCGVHNSGDIGTLDRVLDDLEVETDRRLAVVIASHAHEDHIAGYLRGAERFKAYTIGEVWLPWSENRADPVARGLLARLASLRTALEFQFAARAASQDVLDILANTSVKRNEPALANLRGGLGTGAKVEFLEAGQIRSAPGGIEGLTAIVLGPTRDEAFLRRMDPPKAERYLRATADGPLVEGALHPFGDPPSAKDGGPRLTEAQRKALVKAIELSPESLAFALDRAINNTSIVTLLNYRGRGLLFSGDSQYGGWRSWLDRPDSGDILGDVSFYKVAHHGSENATPKSALEAMRTGGVAAMVSTQDKPWPSIPDGPLMDALARKTDKRVFRSDSVSIAGAPAGPVLGRAPGGFTVGPFWVDHVIPL
jgi:beta-lactamase superfamily II metal-dependent hydrolase